MTAFCPKCGKDAERDVVRPGQVRTARCQKCGARVTVYSDCSTSIWRYDGRWESVDPGCLVTDPGREEP